MTVTYQSTSVPSLSSTKMSLPPKQEEREPQQHTKSEAFTPSATSTSNNDTSLDKRIALLLIDPHSNRFEIVQLNDNSSNNNSSSSSSSSPSTTLSTSPSTTSSSSALLLAQIPYTATQELFRTHISYVAIYGTASLRVALPQEMSLQDCLQWAHSIFTTEPIHSMLIQQGYNLREWDSLSILPDPNSIVLFLDLHTKRFELIQMDTISSSSSCRTMQDCIHHMTHSARDVTLKPPQQNYVGLWNLSMDLCWETTWNEMITQERKRMIQHNNNNNNNNNNNKKNSDDPYDPNATTTTTTSTVLQTHSSSTKNQIWVAIPQHQTIQECVRLARSIISTEAVRSTLHKHGIPIPLSLQEPSCHHHHRVVVLLLDPQKTRRLECVLLDDLFSSSTTSNTRTISSVWDWIATTAQEPYLRQQSYVALCNASQQVLVPTKPLHSLCQSTTWVAIPKGVSIRTCYKMARTIYTSDSVQQLLQQNGLNTNEWCGKLIVDDKRKHQLVT